MTLTALHHPSLEWVGLPNPRPCDRLYLDVETTSFDRKVEAFEPYLGHRICGFAVTWDDSDEAYYVAVRHRGSGRNQDPAIARQWLTDQMALAKRWVNHNVKFDAHFLAVEGAELPDSLGMVDTKVMAYLLDSDRMSHSLKPLCREWLDLPMVEATEVDAFLRGAKTEDYAEAPADLVGKYACMDVVGARALHRHCESRLPQDQRELWRMEERLTPVLFDMERRGLRVDRRDLLVDKHAVVTRLIELGTEIAELTGQEFRDSAQHAHAILCVQRGLPVLARGEDPPHNPSFDEDALKLYLTHPAVIGTASERLVRAILAYRKEETYHGLFLETMLKHADSTGFVHGSYNQNIRTGRMSCSKPNWQQQSKRSKRLVRPRPGHVFLSRDGSQIEFRVIVHYVEDAEAIAAYASDPLTDYHAWVAASNGIDRGEGKTLNFAMAFGAGKRKTTSMLASSEAVMAAVSKLLDRPDLDPEQRRAMFQSLCQQRAEALYAAYHERFPGIKVTSRQAEEAAKRKGYVFNAYGRRRHLPTAFAYKAFNAVVQGTASDLCKHRMVALSPRYCQESRDLGLHVMAQVHDEILFEVPEENADAAEALLDRELPKTEPATFSVPFVWEGGRSGVSWFDALPKKRPAPTPVAEGKA